MYQILLQSARACSTTEYRLVQLLNTFSHYSKCECGFYLRSPIRHLYRCCSSILSFFGPPLSFCYRAICTFFSRMWGAMNDSLKSRGRYLTIICFVFFALLLLLLLVRHFFVSVCVSLFIYRFAFIDKWKRHAYQIWISRTINFLLPRHSTLSVFRQLCKNSVCAQFPDRNGKNWKLPCHCHCATAGGCHRRHCHLYTCLCVVWYLRRSWKMKITSRSFRLLLSSLPISTFGHTSFKVKL